MHQRLDAKLIRGTHVHLRLDVRNELARDQSPTNPLQALMVSALATALDWIEKPAP